VSSGERERVIHPSATPTAPAGAACAAGSGRADARVEQAAVVVDLLVMVPRSERGVVARRFWLDRDRRGEASIRFHVGCFHQRRNWRRRPRATRRSGASLR